MGDFKHATLAGHLRQYFRLARIGDVFAEHHNARVLRHLVLERAVDRRYHRVGLTLRQRRRLELRRRGIDIRREHEVTGRFNCRLGRLQRGLGRLGDFAVHGRGHLVEVGLGRQLFADQERAHLGERIAQRLGRAFVRRLVEPLVVRQRVRVRPDHLGMHERGLALAPHPRHGVADHAVAVDEVGAIAAEDFEVRERLDQLRDIAAGGLHFDRHRNGVAVVFDQVEHRHVARAGRVQRFPEFAFTRRALADRDIGHLVRMKPLLAVGDGANAFVQHASFAGADGLQALRAGGAALRWDIQRLVTPVRRHLPPAGIRIVFRADGAQQHLERRHAELQAERAIAIVGIEPVVAGAQVHSRGSQHGFVSGATDLEKDQALVLELNLLVVDAARQQHRAVGPQQLVACETAPLRARAGGRSCARVGSGCQRRSLHVTKIITPEWML